VVLYANVYCIVDTDKKPARDSRKMGLATQYIRPR
jgi:hypothetical protein